MKIQSCFVAAPIIAFTLSACVPSEQAVQETTTPPPASDVSPSYSVTPAPGEELPSSQTTSGPVPLEFRHVWAANAEDCAAHPSLTRIAIAPGAVKFYEGRSEVTKVDAPHPGAAVLHVTHTAEGQTSTEMHTIALDEAQTSLTYQRGENPPQTYMRCD